MAGHACIVKTYARPNIFLGGTSELNIFGEINLQFGDDGVRHRQLQINTKKTTIDGHHRGFQQSSDSLPQEEFTLKATLDTESFKSSSASSLSSSRLSSLMTVSFIVVGGMMNYFFFL